MHCFNDYDYADCIVCGLYVPSFQRLRVGPCHHFWRVFSISFALLPFSPALYCSHLPTVHTCTIHPILRFLAPISPRSFFLCVLPIATYLMATTFLFMCLCIPVLTRNDTLVLISYHATRHILRNQLFSATCSVSACFSVSASVPWSYLLFNNLEVAGRKQKNVAYWN